MLSERIALAISIGLHSSLLFIGGAKFLESPQFAIGSGAIPNGYVGVELVERKPKSVEVLSEEHRHEVKEQPPAVVKKDDILIPRRKSKPEASKLPTPIPTPLSLKSPTPGVESAADNSTERTSERTGAENSSSSATDTAGNGQHRDAGALVSASPAYFRNPAPNYPREARERRIEGVVRLQVKVSNAGEPLSVQVKQTSGSESLDSAALAAVKKWRFRPARLLGQEVESEVEIPIRFKLEQ